MWTTVDPATGDYVMEVLPDSRGGVPDGDNYGSFERTDSLETPVYLRLFSKRGFYIGDDEFGSRLHELYQRKSPTTAAKEAPDMVQEALQPLVDDGLIASLSVTAEPEIVTEDGSRRSGVAIYVDITDSNDRPYRYRVWQEVGG